MDTLVATTRGWVQWTGYLTEETLQFRDAATVERFRQDQMEKGRPVRFVAWPEW